ncbi:hypothetical protein [Paenibacillus elgii]|uniref:hypothetical protein n=1 Tax=Paenibacillus elgii TaxID=189691 RepID=UPI00203FCDBA|nr:hypothetical protein [Paenibacillus elgii]MCM3273667.1 hypothetical protein [Paenibacillus elgii]
MAGQNALEYAKLFQTALDKQVVAQATSGWMELNSSQVIYNGGNEVKIPKLKMDGLGNYDRRNGFVDGAVTLEYETRKLTQDRGRTFQIDSMDVNESAFIPTASTVMGEFQRTMVIPEIDAYRYSKIAAIAAAGKRVGTYKPDEATVLKRLKQDISDIQDVIGEVELVITMASKIATILENSTELSKQLSVVDFTQGELNTKVRGIDTNPIRKVPSLRMKTSYVFNDGKTAGQEAGGFYPAAGAKDINWIIMPRNAAIAISKTDKIRIFEPDTNQSADAWKLDYRKYHDLWILDNQLPTMFVSQGE